MSEQILPILEADTGRAETAAECMLQIVDAKMR
jgi:hypothetical protein